MGMPKKKFEHRMKEFAKACWVTMEAMHQLFLEDEKPENEKEKMDPDHWYENNLTNASLFANLTLDGLPQLVPGRLFTTRMPRDIVKDPQERKDFVHKCKVNNLVSIVRVGQGISILGIKVWAIHPYLKPSTECQYVYVCEYT